MFSYKVRKFLIRLTTKNLNRTVRPAKYKKYIEFNGISRVLLFTTLVIKLRYYALSCELLFAPIYHLLDPIESTF